MNSPRRRMTGQSTTTRPPVQVGHRAWDSSSGPATTTRGLGATPETVGDADGSAGLLAAVADPVRWTVLQLLAQQQSCVCDLQAHIPIAANLLSYHLKMLREAGLIVGSRRGRWIDYRLADGALARLHDALPASPTPGDRGPVETSAASGCAR